MKTKILIAHALGEKEQAEKLAAPLRKAGYQIAHEGTVLVGDSVIAEISNLLEDGTPVVICATVRAIGTKWARQVINAARHKSRIFIVQMEPDVAVETISQDNVIADYWRDPKKAISALLLSLRKYYPPTQHIRASGAPHLKLPILAKLLRLRTSTPPPQLDLLPIPARRASVVAPNALTAIRSDVESLFTRLYIHLQKIHRKCWVNVNSIDRPRENRTEMYKREFASLTKNDPLPTYKIILTGPTGSGKTTMLTALNDQYKGTFLNLEKYSYFNTAGLPETLFNVPMHTERFYGGDRRIAIIDSFDKMLIAPTRQQLLEAAQIINNVTKNYDVVICAYRSQVNRSTSERIFSDFEIIELCELDKNVLHAYLAHLPELSTFDSIVRDNVTLFTLSQNPLLLKLLKNLHEDGINIGEIAHKIEIFEMLVDTWLERDRIRFLYREASLFLVEPLAEEILKTGNAQFRHRDILRVIAEQYPTASQDYIDKVDVEVRTCTFIFLDHEDYFSFIHPIFYEYCVCRRLISAFNGLALEGALSVRLTDEIFDMFIEHLKINDNLEAAIVVFEDLWNKSDQANLIYNLIHILLKLFRPPSSLSAKHFTQIDFGLLRINLSGKYIEGASFDNCDFSGVNLAATKFKHCVFVRCRFVKPRDFNALFGACEFRKTIIEIGADAAPIFSYGKFMDSTIVGNQKSRARFHGGIFIGTSLACDQERRFRFVMRAARNDIAYAVLKAVSFCEDTDIFSIRDCSIDEVSLFLAADVPAKSRPHFARSVSRAISGARSGRGRPIVSPHARIDSLEGEEFSLIRPMSKTAAKRLNREKHRREQRGKHRSGHRKALP